MWNSDEIFSRKICTGQKNVVPLHPVLKMGVFQSGQMGQTVNLLSFDFGGSNPSAPTRETSKDVSKITSFFYLCIRVRARKRLKKCKNNVFSYTIVLCSHTIAWYTSKETHFFKENALNILRVCKNRRTFATSKDNKSSSIEA